MKKNLIPLSILLLYMTTTSAGESPSSASCPGTRPSSSSSSSSALENSKYKRWLTGKAFRPGEAYKLDEESYTGEEIREYVLELERLEKVLRRRQAPDGSEKATIKAFKEGLPSRYLKAIGNALKSKSAGLYGALKEQTEIVKKL